MLLLPVKFLFVHEGFQLLKIMLLQLQMITKNFKIMTSGLQLHLKNQLRSQLNIACLKVWLLFDTKSHLFAKSSKKGNKFLTLQLQPNYCFGLIGTQKAHPIWIAPRCNSLSTSTHNLVQPSSALPAPFYPIGHKCISRSHIGNEHKRLWVYKW